MSTALQIRPADTMGEWGVIRDQAAILVKTGFLPQSIKTPEQAMAIILTGRELGIGTMAALNTINVIQGKPTISPQLMLALINRSGQIEDITINAEADGVTCTMKRKGRTAHSEHFGHKEAAAMGLNGKDNYKKQAGTMYKWRAVAACARAVFPDVILGLYTPDEMGASVNDDGEVIHVESERAPEAVIIAEPIDNTQTQMINELKELNAALKFDDTALLKSLTGKFGLREGLSLDAALESLSERELSQAIDLLSAKVAEKKQPKSTTSQKLIDTTPQGKLPHESEE